MIRPQAKLFHSEVLDLLNVVLKSSKLPMHKLQSHMHR